MISSRLFWKLFFAFVGLHFVAAIVFGQVVSSWQERQSRQQVNDRLRDAAILVRSNLGDEMSDGRGEKLQEQVHELGRSIETRLSLIAKNGSVLADSAVADLEAVAKMDNHIDRPEFVDAIKNGNGQGERLSPTLDAPYLYYAVRVDVEGKPVGVVRAATPLAVVELRVAQVRHLIWLTTALLALLLLGVVYWIVRYIVGSVNALSRATEAVAVGDYRQRVFLPNRDELGTLVRSFNQMSQELDTRMSQLRQTNQRQATVLGGMIEGVIAVDERERVVFANPAAGRLFGFLPPTAEGRPLLEVVRNHALHEAVRIALDSGQPQRLESEWDGAPGAPGLCMAIQATPLPGDPCPGAVLVLHDTTELRRLETLRREFLANVSHELKTPLSSIKAYAETLSNGAIHDPETSQRFVRNIEEQAERLHNLILDMLSLARIESEQQPFEIVPVGIREVVEACLTHYKAAAVSKRIELVAEAEEPEVFVSADREGLREILDNLVDNAIKYTPDGGKVTVSWQSDGAWARIEVADTGIGIGKEDLPRVFERFYRVDKARSRELGGTGLGLSIVKHLVQSFGGRVSVESEQGKGSRFTVELPMA